MGQRSPDLYVVRFGICLAPVLYTARPAFFLVLLCLTAWSGVVYGIKLRISELLAGGLCGVSAIVFFCDFGAVIVFFFEPLSVLIIDTIIANRFAGLPYAQGAPARPRVGLGGPGPPGLYPAHGRMARACGDHI